MSKVNQAAEVESTDLLDNFNWDTEDSFFGIGKTPAKTELETVIEEAVDVEDEEDEDDTVPTDPKPAKEKKETEDAPFSDTLPAKEEEVTEDEDVTFYSTLATEMKEKSIFQFAQLPEDGKITEEKFFELQEEEIEARTEQTVQDFIAEMKDEDGAAFIRHKRAGGSTREFLDFYSRVNELPEVDTETESGQEKIIKHYLKTVEKLDEDEIEDKLDWLKEGGKQKKYAEKYNQKLSAEAETAKKEFLASQIAAQTAREESRKTYVNTLKSTIDSTENVNGFVFAKKDKGDLLDYIVKPSVKVNGNQYLTAFQSELGRIIKEEPQKLLVLAKLLKNDFDTSDMTVVKQTEATKKIKSSLDQKKSKLASSSGTKSRSLVDYFN